MYQGEYYEDKDKEDDQEIQHQGLHTQESIKQFNETTMLT
jgi:hypothetical protein